MIYRRDIAYVIVAMMTVGICVMVQMCIIFKYLIKEGVIFDS